MPRLIEADATAVDENAMGIAGIRRAAAVALILLGIGLNGSADQKGGAGEYISVTDPVFGLEFHPSMVKYEMVPERVLRTCGGFLPGRYWIFAHLHHVDTEYFVIAGTSPQQNGDIFGSALSITGSKCQAEESTWMLSGFMPDDGYRRNAKIAGLPGFRAQSVCDRGPLGNCHYILRSTEEEAILRGLAQDGLMRGIRAWGGIVNFRKAVCRSDVMKASASMPVVQEELSKFCSQPRTGDTASKL